MDINWESLYQILFLILILAAIWIVLRMVLRIALKIFACGCILILVLGGILFVLNYINSTGAI
jgi:hypothetical protein